jgi:eukaryotic-like serine/threonine-protein kinase
MLALRSGARLGNYELVRMIGSGGMGAVYEARHENLGRNVAIKIIHALAPEAPKGAVLKARFLREGRAAAQVRHAHIVDVFDFGVQDDTPFLVMELIEGESLAERIARERVLALAAALEIILPVLSAVGELHAAGIIHRDLKPANILLGRGRAGEVCPKVADFGVSRMDDDPPGLTESGAVVGTYPYMPPEQARACKTATEQADQYALGAILYECLTGKPPFEGESPYDLTHAILHAPLVPPTERNSGLPKALDAVVLRALNRDPDSRFGCVGELAAALLSFAEPAVKSRWAGEFLVSTGDKNPATIAPVSGSVGRAAPTRRPWGAASAIRLSAIAFAGVLVGTVVLRARPQVHQEVASGAPALTPAAPLVVSETSAPFPTTAAAPLAPPVITPPSSASVSPPAASAPSAPSARTKPLPSAHLRKEHAGGDGAALDNGAPLLDP